VVAEEAQVQVLHQQKIYQRVVAPFDGVITQRNVDIGSFVQADATSGTFMFTIMQGMSSEPRCSCRRTRRSDCSPVSRPWCTFPKSRIALFPARRRGSPMPCGRPPYSADRNRYPPDGTLTPGIYRTIELRIPCKTRVNPARSPAQSK
jgi:hypothetical protein